MSAEKNDSALFISRNIFEDTPMNENILDKAKASAAVIKHKVSDLKENFWDDEKKKSLMNIKT